MNLVSLLILPAVISLRHNNGARFSIAAVALVVLAGAIAFSKRKTAAMDTMAGDDGSTTAARPFPAASPAAARLTNGGTDEVLVAAIDQWIYDPGSGDHELRVRLLEIKARLGNT